MGYKADKLRRRDAITEAAIEWKAATDALRKLGSDDADEAEEHDPEDWSAATSRMEEAEAALEKAVEDYEEWMQARRASANGSE